MTLKKMNLLGCFKIEKKRDNDNETGLKEGKEVTKIFKLQCFPLHDARSLSLFDIFTY